MMIKGKRGVSTIVVTVIMVALVLVALGVVWAVLSGVWNRGTASISHSDKCIGAMISATAVNCGATDCKVSLERTGMEDYEIAGVKLVFENAAGGRSVIIPDSVGNIEKLIPETATVLLTAIVDSGGVAVADPDKVEVIAYFKDVAGEEKLCSENPYNF